MQRHAVGKRDYAQIDTASLRHAQIEFCRLHWPGPGFEQFINREVSLGTVRPNA